MTLTSKTIQQGRARTLTEVQNLISRVVSHDLEPWSAEDTAPRLGWWAPSVNDHRELGTLPVGAHLVADKVSGAIGGGVIWGCEAASSLFHALRHYALEPRVVYRVVVEGRRNQPIQGHSAVERITVIGVYDGQEVYQRAVAALREHLGEAPVSVPAPYNLVVDSEDALNAAPFAIGWDAVRDVVETAAPGL